MVSLFRRRVTVAMVAATALLTPLVSVVVASSPAAYAAVQRHEAEAATVSNGTVASNHTGFSGSGFVDYTNVTGSFVEWTVTAAQAGPVSLALRYANGTSTDRPMDIAVNGTVASAGRSFAGTGSWDTWATSTVTAALAAGTNTVRATATTANGGPNVDWLEVDDQSTGGIDWSTAMVESTMARHTPADLGGWGYQVGLYLYGQYLVYQRTHDPRYLAYIKAWVDRFVDGSGNISQSFDSLDSMQSGNLLIILWRETGQAKYRTAAQKIRTRLNTYPRTSDGGFWHATADSRQGQLWGDGAFMVDPFLVRYGQAFDDSSFGNDEAARQLQVYGSHLFRTSGNAAGLLYHAYDEPGGLTASWAHPELGNTNGLSWCRAIGWYGMATIDVLELLPATHPRRQALIDNVRTLVGAFARFQDPASGRWFQLVDQGSNPNNWTETSCSSMYTFVISRAVERGYVSSNFQANADRGYQGVLNRISLGSDGRTNLTEICTGTNADDSASFYFARPRATNDLHGLGSFLIMNEQMIRTAH